MDRGRTPKAYTLAEELLAADGYVEGKSFFFGKVDNGKLHMVTVNKTKSRVFHSEKSV